MELNVDGAVSRSDIDGCGGLFRNNVRLWIIGFIKFLGSCNVITPKL